MKTRKKLNVWLAMPMFLLMMACTTAAGETIYVDADASGANDGSSWTDAHNFLQDALSAAVNGDEIRIAQGAYKPDQGGGQTPSDQTATFQLKNGVTLKGGYAGAGTPDPNVRNIDLYETILTGDLKGNDVDVNDPRDLLYEPTRSENSYHVVTGSGTDATAILDGFTITGGNANGSGIASSSGGGIHNYSGSPTVINCTFAKNSARQYGGGMFNWHSSSPTLTNCIFICNYAGQRGAGMHNTNTYSYSPTLTNCTFSGNSAAYYSGGLHNYKSSPKLTNCTFTGNSAVGGGGGMSNWHSSNSTLINCTFRGNSAENEGGAMYNLYSGSPMVTNCILWGNTAPSGPQIHNDVGGSATVSYSDVQGGWPGIGNINADPLFVDPAIGDYHLLPGSPCINAGDPNYIAEPNETDLDGLPRVIGGRIDMGAYEYANTAPVACIVDGNRIVEAEAPWGARVTLDGSCSSDSDSAPGTNDDIAHFDWYKVDACDPNFEDFLASGEIIDCNLPLGEHIIVLEVIDKAGAFDTNEVTIIVQDTTPPVITLNGPATMTLECGVDSYTEPGATATDICDSNVPVIIGGDTVDTSTCGTYVVTYDTTDASGNAAEQVTRTVIVQDTIPPEFTLSVTPDTLWPANHKMVLITPTWTASDICDASPEVTLVSITMNEGGEAKGDGHTTLNIQIGDDGSIYLRAERSGAGSGRIYTITYQAVDDSGNAAVARATVTVPHDQR